MLGAGTISEQVVMQLRDRGIAQLLGDESLAGTCAKTGGGISRNSDAVGRVGLGIGDAGHDRVFGGAEEPILDREIIERAMSARGNRALLLMDLGIAAKYRPGGGRTVQRVSVQSG